jgi:hypothetical protein
VIVSKDLNIAVRLRYEEFKTMYVTSLGRHYGNLCYIVSKALKKCV